MILDHRKDSLQTNQPLLCMGLIRGGWNKDTFGCELQCGR